MSHYSVKGWSLKSTEARTIFALLTPVETGWTDGGLKNMKKRLGRGLKPQVNHMMLYVDFGFLRAVQTACRHLQTRKTSTFSN